jgi:F-type H+-transporting ATPase subunit alpha
MAQEPNEVKKVLECYIHAAVEPSAEQISGFKDFLEKKYNNREIVLEYKMDKTIGKGFKLIAGDDIYDWTEVGRFAQFRDFMEGIRTGGTISGDGRYDISRPAEDVPDLVTLIKSSIEDWSLAPIAEEEGHVSSVGDGIVVAKGLESVEYGEIVVFDSGVKGMVQDLKPDEVGIILFGSDDDVSEGSRVRRTKKTAGVPVGDDFLGRVVDSLGNPIDGKGPINADGYRPIETPAPGIVKRQSVDTPMNTGIVAIDSMFPIGRGQRELIIGDRQTGKTAIAVDTILNQKGNGVICIYVAIGQKASSIAQLVDNLNKHGAMDYTIVVAATASSSAPIQYIAPYAGCAIAEYFMYKGKDVLIVYDDLSKHAIAYRALSLLLERSPGREAYPGDVFYLHSRLLERSARLSDDFGGGSITALPIVETQAGDVSAYIPTNIISITDGQIFLESDLFFAGQRPAVNVGLSVSRVGGAAQTKAMKKAAGTIRLDLAQYREMEIFTQFSSDLDETTKRQLAYGQGLMRLLRQPQSRPFKPHEQIIMLVAATAHVMQDIKADDITKFREGLLDYFHEEESDICEKLEKSGQMDDELKAEIIEISKKYLEIWQTREK